MPWTSDETTLQQMQDRIRRFSAERSWARYHNPRNLAMQISVEAGELLQLYLWSSDDGPQPPVATRAPKVEEEMADVAISLLNLAAVTGIDLAAAIERKLEKNAARYPVGKSRGRLEKYDELADLPDLQE